MEFEPSENTGQSTALQEPPKQVTIQPLDETVKPDGDSPAQVVAHHLAAGPAANPAVDSEATHSQNGARPADLPAQRGSATHIPAIIVFGLGAAVTVGFFVLGQ